MSIPSVVFADEAVPEEVMSDEAMAEEAMPAEPEVSPEMQGHIGDSHSGPVWYGSIRAGVTSVSGSEGMGSFGSRWGIMGSSEVSEGLTAVYRFEDAINATDATSGTGRLSYVGLTGGFGTITLGNVWSSTYNTFGVITDLGGPFATYETSYRLSNAISYAVSIGNVSLQADVIMNKDGGNSESATPATPAATTILTPPDQVEVIKEDKGVDAYEFGVSVGGLMETGKIAFAHKKHDSYKYTKKSSNYIAGEYGIGGMTIHLGVSQHKSEDDTACVTLTADEVPAETTVTLNDDEKTTTTTTKKATPAKYGKFPGCTGVRQTDKTTFAGIRGDVGDTGVSYLVQVRSTKTKGNDANIDGKGSFAKGDVNKKGVLKDASGTEHTLVSELTYVLPKDGTGTELKTGDAVDPNGQALAANKTTPWVFGLYRSLGGGASVNFEYADDDTVGAKGKSALWLRVDF